MVVSGVDWGGVRREWFSLLCGKLFDARCGLFVSCQDSPAGLVHPNPERPAHLKVCMVARDLYWTRIAAVWPVLMGSRLS